MKAYTRSRGIDPLILILGIRWRGVFKFMLPLLLPLPPVSRSGYFGEDNVLPSPEFELSFV